MDPTLTVMDFMFNKKYKTVHRGRWNKNKVIRDIVLWSPDQQPEDEGRDMLYITENPADMAAQDTVLLHVLSEDEVPAEDTESYYYLIAEKGCKTGAVNDVLRVCHLFYRWAHMTEHAALYEHDTQKMLDLTDEYLDAEIIIMDDQYLLTYVSKPERNRLVAGRIDGAGRLVPDAVNQLYLKNPEFDSTFRTEGVVRYQPGSNEVFHLYYYNLHDNGQYIARTLFRISSGADPEAVMMILGYFTDLLDICYRYNYKKAHSIHALRELRRYTRQLLDGRTVKEMALLQALRENGWEPSHTYELLYLLPRSYTHSSNTMEYLCPYVENALSACIAVGMENHIICIHNQSADQNGGKFGASLPYFLRDNLFVAGISVPFEDYSSCCLYGREAAAAIAIGMKQNPDFWIYYFADYSLRYGLEKITEDFPAEDMCHSAVLVLRKYDAAHPGTELAQTLRQYLICHFNASQAAEALHIHRTTFLYRMRKISELTALNLEDWDTVLHLMLSFTLLQNR